MAKKEQNLVKEPVRVRIKELANGNRSIYLDCYVNGARKYHFLNIYLRPETGKDRKANAAWNKEQLRLAEAIKAQFIIDIQNGEYGFKDYNIARKTNLIEYCQDIEEEDLKKGKETSARLMRTLIRRLIRYKGKVIPLNSVDKNFVIGFLEFLNGEIRERSGTNRVNNREPKLLSENTKLSMYERLCVALNKAERDNLIMKNPCNAIENKYKPKRTASTRCYLTLHEVKKIMKLDYSPKSGVREAFLFCCFTGLRYSDVQALTWSDIKTNSNGDMQIESKMKKTGKEMFVPLSKNALIFLPQRDNAPDSQKVFAHLPRTATMTHSYMRRIEELTGIKKHITFHVSRHTFATLSITYGADLYTVSKLLGHSSVQVTQVYAKIVDENKRKAVNLIPKI
ncbi:MAG: tyrosine-type recombinase/integrase [Candidatus Cryptobacteroides sp.]